MYDRGKLKIWVVDISMENLHEVASKNRDNYTKGFGDDFNSDFMKAMGELRDSVKVNDNDNANAALIKIKGSLDREELRKLQYIKKTRNKNRKE